MGVKQIETEREKGQGQGTRKREGNRSERERIERGVREKERPLRGRDGEGVRGRRYGREII